MRSLTNVIVIFLPTMRNVTDDDPSTLRLLRLAWLGFASRCVDVNTFPMFTLAANTAVMTAVGINV